MNLEGLAQQIAKRNVVLFVGAGLSMNMGLPSWQQLMEKVAEELGYDSDVLIHPDADYLQIAEYYTLSQQGISKLQSWLQKEWEVDDKRLANSSVHQRIVDLDFPFIYTTNFDAHIERAFELRNKKFCKIVTVSDFVQASIDSPHIVKFHGDLGVEDSLVLTESQYFNRLSFESPLDIKFRSDMIGRSILFVGYSLKDINLRVLLYRIQKIWTLSGQTEERPTSYIFLMRPDAVQKKVLKHRGIETIEYDGNKPENALLELFESLLKAVSAIRSNA